MTLVNVKYEGKTALILAVEKEKEEIVQMLCFWLLRKTMNEEIVEMVLEKYTPVTLVYDMYEGKTALNTEYWI